MVVTASLTTGIACVAAGVADCLRLIDQILRIDHIGWETSLYVGDSEFYRSRDGPYPNHQVRVSVRPSAGYAALAYIDHDDSLMSVALSFNRQQLGPDVHLVFNGSIGAVFPPRGRNPCFRSASCTRGMAGVETATDLHQLGSV